MHNHGVGDGDIHFTIDPANRSIKNNSIKKGVIQFDHNSERLTFSLPRHIERHDMSLCNKVEVHYINIEQNTGKSNADVYEVDDLRVDENDNESILFSWLISKNATQYAGFVYFAIKFFCVNEDGVIDYEWNTGTYQKFGVFNGIQNSQAFVEKYIDVLTKWKQDLIDASTSSTKEQVSVIINEYLEENPPQVPVDDELSDSSDNPVQNKVITTELNKKADLDEDGKIKAEQIPEAIKVKTDNTLKLNADGTLGVNTAKEVEKDNTLPITAAAVHTTVGNIEVLLGTI